jgi:5'-3' exonuclease
MGIPSYFRRIIQKYPGIVTKNKPKSNKLYFDFNCLIYRCIRAKDMPEWTRETHVSWETCLIKEVVKTVKEVVREAGNPKKIYLGIDGVVPMAKIRQQRVRRFKSVWLKSPPSGQQKSPSEKQKESWDSNSITPGTEFMDKLFRGLEGHGWEVSGVHEPGEGEHKIMNKLRSEPLNEKDDVIVYGLDADLILLSILTAEKTGKRIWLLREEQEFSGGGLRQDPDGEQLYTFMNLEELKKRIGIHSYRDALNYIGLMSLMGNDFLPHSITHKLNDDGHEYVMREFETMKRNPKSLLVGDDEKININNLKEICKRWSADESDKMFLMIKKKREQAGRGVLKGMEEIEGLPLEWKVESCLIDEEGQLIDGWRDVYYKEFIKLEKERVCKEYIYGCQWIIDYYTGKEVDMKWMMPTWVPPLWKDIGNYDIKSQGELTTSSQRGIEVYDLKPQEQLAMVLPKESWGLIRDSNLRKLPEKAPQYWPTKFSFFSVGRKWLWECEASLPSLSADRMRSILREND